MTTDEIKALRALCEAATPGPWTECGADRGGCQCGIVYLDEHAIHSATVKHTNDDSESYQHDEQDHRNAAFIAAARTALPALLDELARTRAQLDEARERLGMAESFRVAPGALLFPDRYGWWWLRNDVDSDEEDIGASWIIDNKLADGWPSLDAAFAALAAARKEQP